MSELDCKICFYPLDKNKFLPRILYCGHTFCSPCVSELIETSKICPTCRRPLAIESINDYPVNYIVLELKYTAKDLEKNKLKFIEKYKSNLLTLKQESEELKPFVISLKDHFESCEMQLDKLIESSDDVDSASDDTAKEIENALETIRKQIKSDSSDLLPSLSFHLQDCKPDFDIIAEIRKGISDHKTVAALSVINGVKKFARISLRENFLFIHSFETKQELGEDQDDLITFSYAHLQNYLFQVIENKNIYGFLDLTYQTKIPAHRVVIKVLKSALYLGSSFLMLCTGEKDISYKGHYYSQKYKDKNTSLSNSSLNSHISSVDVDKIIKIKNFAIGGKSIRDGSLYSGYFDSNHAYSGCSFDTNYLSFKADGSFEIFKLYNKVITPGIINYHTQGCPLCTQVTYNMVCNSCRVNVTVVNPRSIMNATGKFITLSDDVYHVPNVVGRIIDLNENFELTFKNATFGKVVDCGIGFSL